MKMAYIRRSVQLILTVSLLGSPLSCSTERFEHITTSTSVEALSSGKLLVDGLAACGFCHGESPKPDSPLSGGQLYSDLYGERRVPSITTSPHALGSWTNDQLLHYFRTGLDKEGDQLSQAPHRGMEWMADEDLFAIVAYLRSLPSVNSKEFHAEALTFVDRNTNGFFEGRREVAGFVPTVSKKAPIRYGQYLVEHVAACGRCHNSPNSIMQSSQFLQGGSQVVTNAGEKQSPNITNDPEFGIGRWEEDQIVAFLKTGVRAQGGKIDTRFCPVDFYRNAPDEDLRSIARFLKTVTSE